MEIQLRPPLISQYCTSVPMSLQKAVLIPFCLFVTWTNCALMEVERSIYCEGIITWPNRSFEPIRCP